METNKILLLVGIPASGKTTYALNFINRNENYVRVNKDDLRKSFFGSAVVDDKSEKIIETIQNSIIENSIASRKNVIVDNTNLSKEKIEILINRFRDRADIELMFFHIPLKTAIERDSLRDKLSSVGEEKLKKYFNKFSSLVDSMSHTVYPKIDTYFKPIPHDTKLKTCVIFDLDGTLANKGNRGYFDWDKVDRDHLNEIVAEHVDFHKNKGREIIIVSGRDDVSLELTQDWLDFYQIHYDEIYMRPKDDHRKDDKVKKEIYENYIKDKYNVHCVYDDRFQVVNMWHNLGLFVFNVNQGNKIF